ncbi:MAG: cytochrome d ubiquinol oxidase subunit II [Micavibrio aeruginosavorus]|uniref:Cytochrome d ubiquinol oxidase subunit II n=1 Tax=Micavibrio aeruginosavorus TaxID=349221 RepID=A0A2W5FI33_9BACT|nr:MAG: cytochrome d ubiquinol oxidase subunit II [Micavibrio aeruginosavorus]
MNQIIASGDWLPLIFAFLMGFSMLVYALLDGYDLGVGLLVSRANDQEKNIMISSIGPFWDANETWLVLGVGLLLVAFPLAHGVILSSLYIPVAIMLTGIIFRGVSFDFRSKAHTSHRKFWNWSFFSGSLITSVSQGYMLGSYILGFDHSLKGIVFSVITGFALASGYALIGACWLIMKTEGDLQRRAVHWARMSLIGAIAAILLVSLATPLVSPRIFDKWFTSPEIFYLLPIPALTGLCILGLFYILSKLPKTGDRHCWMPFVLTIATAVLCFIGMAYSFYPFIVPETLNSKGILIVEAASAPQSLMIILVGALVVIPCLLAYTFFAYKVFHGKATDLRYD